MCQGRREGGSSGEIGRGETQLDPPANEMAPHMLAQMKSRQSLKKGGHAMLFYFWRRN